MSQGVRCLAKWITRFRSVKTEDEGVQRVVVEERIAWEDGFWHSRACRCSRGEWIGMGEWVFSPKCSAVGSSQAGSQCVVSLRVVVMLFCSFLSFWFRPSSSFSAYLVGTPAISCYCDFFYSFMTQNDRQYYSFNQLEVENRFVFLYLIYYFLKRSCDFMCCCCRTRFMLTIINFRFPGELEWKENRDSS